MPNIKTPFINYRDAVNMKKRCRAALSLKARAAENEEEGSLRKFDATISSDEPVQMRWGKEILLHNSENIDVESVMAGRCNLLDGHQGQPIGRITNVHCDGTKATATIEMMSSGRSGEVAAMWENGIGTNLSIGYEIVEYIINDERKDITVSKWRLLEVSMVGVPADKNAGVMREDGSPAPAPWDRMRLETPEKQENRLSDESDPPERSGTAVDAPPPVAASKEVNADKRSQKMPIENDEIQTLPDLQKERAEIRQYVQKQSEEWKFTDDLGREAHERGEEAIVKLEAQDYTADQARLFVRESLLDIASRTQNSGIKKIDISREGQVEAMYQRGGLGPVNWLQMHAEAGLSRAMSPDDFIRAAVLAKDSRFKLSNEGKEVGLALEYSQEWQRNVPPALRGEGVMVPPEVRAFSEMLRVRRESKNSQRNQTVTGNAGGQGGNLVQTDVYLNLIEEYLYASAMLNEFGTTMLTGLVGNVQIPRMTSKPTAAYYSETGTITASSFAIGEIGMTPHRIGTSNGYSYQAVTQVPGNFMSDLVMRHAMKTLDETRDAMFLNGDGSGSNPQGVLNVSGLGVVSHGTNGGPVTFRKTSEAELDIRENNVMSPVAKLLTPRIAWARRHTARFASSDSKTIYDMSDPMHRYVETNSLPTNLSKGTGRDLHAEITADPTEIICGEFGALNVIVNPYSEDREGRVRITMQTFNDIIVRRIGAVVISRDINPNA